MAVLSCSHCGASKTVVEIRNCNQCKHYVCQVCSGLWRDRQLSPTWTFHEAVCSGCVAAYEAANAPYEDELPTILQMDDHRLTHQ
jgi:hypothetical protein